ncbi:MAG: NAD-dependent epimerase/dehydratase family protein [Fimbriimonadales bacterium]
MRVLVLGGTRFIGVHAVRGLLSAGHELLLFHRGQNQNKLEGAAELLGDREKIADFRGRFEEFAPEVILDMCCYTESAAAATLKTLEEIAERVVLISSCDVYRAFGKLIGTEQGETENTWITEKSPLRENRYPYRDPANESEWRYWYDKIPIEQMFLESAMKVRILRLPMVYGELDYQRRMGSIIRRIIDGRSAMVISENLANWRTTRSHVKDVAQAIRLAVETEFSASSTYNVGEQEAVSVLDWYSEIANALDWGGTLVSLPDSELPEIVQSPGNYHQNLLLNSSAIRTELGYEELTSRQQSVAEAAQWELRNPLPVPENQQQQYDAEDALLNRICN